MKTYKGNITKLKPNQVFVFGSNTEGRHGGGAALVAYELFGANYGQSRGPQGQSWAIVTKDLTKTRHPSISKSTIITQIQVLYGEARITPEKEYFIAYSGTGRNLNYYTPAEMAEMFSDKNIPDNIVFEEEFAKLVKRD